MKAKIQFWYTGGRGYNVGRDMVFNDLKHFDNYIKWMERKGYILNDVWTEDEKLLQHLQK